MNKCPFSCPMCERGCRAAQPYNHRFDCCGVISAHVIEGRNGAWQRINNPMQAGYLTGPSQTTGPLRGSEPDGPTA